MKLLAYQYILDMLGIFFGILLAYWLQFKAPWNSGNPIKADINLSNYSDRLLLSILLFVVLLIAHNLYHKKNLGKPEKLLGILAKIAIFWLLCILSLSVIVKMDPRISRLFIFYSMLSVPCIIYLQRHLFHIYLRTSGKFDQVSEQILLIGWKDEFAKLFHDSHTTSRRYKIHTVIPISNDCKMIPLSVKIATYEELDNVINGHKYDSILIADSSIETKEITKIATLCAQYHIDFKIIPTCFLSLHQGLSIEFMNTIPVLGVTELPLDKLSNRVIKRTLDLLGASIGLLISIPITAILAILIYIESPGSIFYRQQRIGKRGRPITITKLRSMKLNAETDTGPIWAEHDDERQLKIGRFMRFYFLDEIPQFWNVLTGDMSLVGPRPERPELIEKFKNQIPSYNLRHNARPGLSGWAQINGYRGKTDLIKRIEHDIYYLEHWSLWLDMKIILLTFIFPFGRQNQAITQQKSCNEPINTNDRNINKSPIRE